MTTKRKNEPLILAPPPKNPFGVKFVRRTEGGKYEHGHAVLGSTRKDDKYVRTGVVDTYDEAANASNFEPAVEHKPAGGATFYELPAHTRNQGNHSRTYRG